MKKEKTPDLIFCPFKEIVIERVSSELLDKIGGLPLLILLQISHNKTINEIADGLVMQPWVISDAAEELVRNGLLDKEETNNYALTDIGVRYVRIYKFIKDFQSEQQRRYAVNLFTCQLESVKDERCFANTEHHDNSMQLPNKLKSAERLISTPNYENTLEYMKQYLDLSGVALTDDDYEFIQFQLRTKGEIFFVPYSVSANAYLKVESDSNERPEHDASIPHYIWLSVPLTEGKRIYEYTSVSAEVGEALLKMNSLAPEFLTAAAKNHIEKLKQAEKFTQKSDLLVIDAYGGSKYKLENDNVKTTDFPHHVNHFSLSERYFFPTESKQAEIKGGEFYYHYEVIRKYTIPVKIDFTILVQSEVEEF